MIRTENQKGNFQKGKSDTYFFQEFRDKNINLNVGKLHPVIYTHIHNTYHNNEDEFVLKMV